MTKISDPRPAPPARRRRASPSAAALVTALAVALAVPAATSAAARPVVRSGGLLQQIMNGLSPQPEQPPPPSPPAPAPRPPAPPRTSGLRPPRSRILSDRAAAARVRRTGFEPRPGNRAANRRPPTARELKRWRAASNYRRLKKGAYYLRRVTGRFTGTTDEILQWAAWKWGLDEEWLRAQAVDESAWDQREVGDGGVSFGIMQLKSTKQRGTYPLSRRSTPFNLDYAAMMIRHCYDGYATWLGRSYRRGDMWGCLGWYFSGRWYDAGARRYIARVKRELSVRAWEQAGF